MDPNRVIRSTLRWLERALRAVWWCASTAWVGLRSMVWCGRLLATLPDVLADRRLCPRGHTVPQFDVYDCRCGARHEGWAFGRCVVCGESAGWIPCPECGLPVLNPLRGLGL